ncbi:MULTISPECIES: glycosyltransferase [Pseudomonas]|uniref:Glycosyltransferase n=2 Tax=unclassified Pseudomonas TaxID=196821 RepID=A0AB39HZH8_9PSED|nr:glycosyltransferase [Pseudomonas sp. 5]KJK09031.1 glycosyl transferase [Pseudomonas sp. 5]MDH2560206.1 glycosyltransferase [Pseudomonas sp. Hg5Tf]
MNIVNIMWAGGAPYVSVHKVHQQILSRAAPNASVTSWLLQGHGSCCNDSSTREWQLSQRLLKGRHVWKLLHPWMRSRFRNALKQAGTQVVLLDGLGVSRLVLPVLRQLPQVRATIVFHGKTRLHRGDIALLRSFQTPQVTLVAVSQTLADDLQRDLGVPVQVLRSALEPESFRQVLLERTAARQSLGLPLQGVPVFGAVGRLVDSKGFDHLIDAFALARQRQPDIHLVILGEGNERPVLESRIRALGLEAVVTLHGHCRELSSLYRAFDWVLIPSRSEGLGLVLQEAVMADVPVLCSDLSVFREQLGDTGGYIAVGDVAAWGEAIADCVSRDGKQVAKAQYQALAPEQAWQRFSQLSGRLLGKP